MGLWVKYIFYSKEKCFMTISVHMICHIQVMLHESLPKCCKNWYKKKNGLYCFFLFHNCFFCNLICKISRKKKRLRLGKDLFLQSFIIATILSIVSIVFILLYRYITQIAVRTEMKMEYQFFFSIFFFSDFAFVDIASILLQLSKVSGKDSQNCRQFHGNSEWKMQFLLLVGWHLAHH